MSDIELIRRTAGNSNFRFAILPNIRDQRYTFGSRFPGERAKEEFFFWRYKNYIEPIHCFITVDGNGQFWIENATETAKTFVNREVLQGRRILEYGDHISFGVSKSIEELNNPGPVLLVTERRIEETHDNENTPSLTLDSATYFSPGDNNLVLSKILRYLDIPTLKICRQVSSVWNLESSRTLVKRGRVVFNLQYYIKPMESSKIFRYFHEVKQLRFDDIEISLPELIPPNYYHLEEDRSDVISQKSLRTCPGEPGEKLLIDVKKLANSVQQFTTLRIKQNIKSCTDFEILQEILQKLGNGLESLKMSCPFFYEVTEETPKIELEALRKFEHLAIPPNGTARLEYNEKKNCYKKWVKFIVPSIRQTLEELSCSGNLLEFYIKEFQKCSNLPRFTALSVEGISFSGTNLLLEGMKYPLTRLSLTNMSNIQFIKEQKEADNLSKLIEKYAETLEFLRIEIDANEIVEIKFPTLKKLKQLHIKYTHTVRICWQNGRNRVDYCKDFPVLEVFSVKTILQRMDGITHPVIVRTFDFKWENEGDLFNSLFGDYSASETVRILELEYPKIPNDKANEFARRLGKFQNMFPNSEKFITEKIIQERGGRFRRMLPF